MKMPCTSTFCLSPPHLAQVEHVVTIFYRIYRKNRETGFPSTMIWASNYLDWTSNNSKAAMMKYEAHKMPRYQLPNLMDVFRWSLR
jgi:hypothetical protein